MPALCFYFQVHQPYRLRRYSYFDIGVSDSYFDDALNALMMKRVAERCYLPANRTLLKLIKEHGRKFKVSFSITGVTIEQMKLYAPEALASFKELAATGCVEFLGETYYHSLAALYSAEEFRAQVLKHSALIEQEFGTRPKVFRNTELIYSDAIGAAVSELGFQGVLAEGVDEILGWRSCNSLFRVQGRSTALLLKNYPLSDEIAFRFSSSSLDGTPLTAQNFAQRIHKLPDDAEMVGLFLDYETFGEHHHAESGIFSFLEELPEAVLAEPGWSFATLSEIAARSETGTELSFPRTTSWADTARDTSAWCGNQMQSSALEKIYASSLASDSEAWRKLQTSDHLYYMCTKGGPDGQVHSYFSPFESPYEAFIAYMNVLRDLVARSKPVFSKLA